MAPRATSPKRAALGRPAKVGFLGAGNVLWAYLQSLDRLIPRGIAVEGPVAARNAEVWSRIRSNRPGVDLVADVDSVLNSDVDVVVVITSPDSHAGLTRRALEAGKHVVVEKPLAESVEEARQLADLAIARERLLVAAPFVAASPTFRMLWRFVADGRIGEVHSARALYGNAGSTWAKWYHDSSIGPLAEIGIYNLKSLALLLGPVTEVTSCEARAFDERTVAGIPLADPDPDVNHVILRHAGGALSSTVSSYAIQAYRRPAVELYGTHGTANLLGDDWDPRGVDIWTAEAGCWQSHDCIDSTWLWTDGLADLVRSLHSADEFVTDLSVDVHLIEVLAAARRSAESGRAIAVRSTFEVAGPGTSDDERHYVHDRTRPADLQ